MPELWMDLDEFRDFVSKVAAEIGMVLNRDDPLRWGARIESIDMSTGYYLTLPRLKDRKTEITPVYPHSTFGWYKTRHGKIGVTVTRGPHAVAAEITRRLEPLYLSNLARIRVHDAEEAAAHAARDGLAAQITDMFAAGTVHAPGHCQSEYRTELVIPGPQLGGGWVRFSGSGDEVEFERFRVTRQVALQMLAAHAGYVRSTTQEESAT